MAVSLAMGQQLMSFGFIGVREVYQRAVVERTDPLPAKNDLVKTFQIKASLGEFKKENDKY